MTSPDDGRDPTTAPAARDRDLMHQMPVGRVWDRFRADPSSARKAAAVIVMATLLTVLVSAVAMWLLDRLHYPDIGVALWWATQTVTTVGYGDVAPVDPIGRTVASLVMLEGVAFMAIVTASITSVFVESRQSERRAGAEAAAAAHRERLEARLAEISGRLEAIERAARSAS